MFKLLINIVLKEKKLLILPILTNLVKVSLIVVQLPFSLSNHWPSRISPAVADSEAVGSGSYVFCFLNSNTAFWKKEFHLELIQHSYLLYILTVLPVCYYCYCSVYYVSEIQLLWLLLLFYFIYVRNLLLTYTFSISYICQTKHQTSAALPCLDPSFTNSGSYTRVHTLPKNLGATLIF